MAAGGVVCHLCGREIVGPFDLDRHVPAEVLDRILGPVAEVEAGMPDESR